MSSSPIKIDAPVDGKTYPGAGLNPVAVPTSFTVTKAGNHQVEWGFEGNEVGRARFYDRFQLNQDWKLPAGKYRFWVRSRSDKAEASFTIAEKGADPGPPKKKKGAFAKKTALANKTASAKKTAFADDAEGDRRPGSRGGQRRPIAD